MKQFDNIETILENIDTKKYIVPEDWNYKKARELFVQPEVADPVDLEVTCNA